jgi:hypothetical protein
MADRSPATPADQALLAQTIRAFASAIRARTTTEVMVGATRHDRRLAALLLKRTYRVVAGRCELLPAAEQVPITLIDVPYGQVDPPRVAPVIALAETSAGWKPRTDVVVQATAYAYDPGTTRSTAGFRIGELAREIVVVGDRRGEVDAAGRFRFSEPKPFTSIPVRWDHAYGGFDLVSWRRRGRETTAAVQRTRPEWGGATMTPWHCQRNPSGSGWLVDLDAESFAGLLLPNLEHPWDALTPQRIAAGGERRWMRTPLPAAWDFVPASWFPRTAWTGISMPHDPADEPPAEVKRGWLPETALRTPSLVHATDPGEVPLELAQAAAPGLSVASIDPGARVELTNLHPQKPVTSFDLPGEVPRVRIALRGGTLEDIPVHLATLVVRATTGEVEMLWSARFDAPKDVHDDDLDDLKREVAWQRPASGGG